MRGTRVHDGEPHERPAVATVSGSPTSSISTTAAGMSAPLAQNWWAVALRGVFAILFGLIALFVPGRDDPVARPVLLRLHAGRRRLRHRRGRAGGAAATSAGDCWCWRGSPTSPSASIAFIWPGLTAVVFVLMLAAWSLVTGVLMIVAAFRLNPAYGRGWLIFSGVVSVLFGIALVIAPLVGARGADLVARRLCARVRHRPPGARASSCAATAMPRDGSRPGRGGRNRPMAAASCLTRAVQGPRRRAAPRCSAPRSGAATRSGRRRRSGVGTGCSTRPVMSTM